MRIRIKYLKQEVKMKEAKITKSKFIFITGGVCSSLGKGIAAASIGMLLKSSGLKVFVMKMDPYLNVDPGTMNPAQHGEVFVSDDGAETDLDLGHYERIIDQPITKISSVSSGQIYNEISEKERKGDFLGETIQIIPHITDKIKEKILTAAETSGADIVIIEIGGTVGDIEGEPFLEAIRQLRDELPFNFTLSVHLSFLIYLESSNELKTKPTQHSVALLKKYGIRPDIILARADRKISEHALAKISKFCGVPEKAIIPAPTVENIYEIPLNFQKRNIVELIGKKL
ncbi:MAG: CTP synthase, partial [Patescibacteria group bacterium]